MKNNEEEQKGKLNSSKQIPCLLKPCFLLALLYSALHLRELEKVIFQNPQIIGLL